MNFWYLFSRRLCGDALGGTNNLYIFRETHAKPSLGRASVGDSRACDRLVQRSLPASNHESRCREVEGFVACMNRWFYFPREIRNYNRVKDVFVDR